MMRQLLVKLLVVSCGQLNRNVRVLLLQPLLLLLQVVVDVQGSCKRQLMLDWRQ
jgi:hypothetical protein